MTCVSVRWAKGGVLLEGARESVFVTTADHSFFTEPVSCQVFNVVGSTNVSILVDVHCEYEPPSAGRHCSDFTAPVSGFVCRTQVSGPLTCVCVEGLSNSQTLSQLDRYW